MQQQHSATTPVTPLERRARSQQVQRALRVALTGLRALRTSYADASDAGEKQLSAACNLLLRLLHVPAMPLPKEMRAALPDVRDAARAKLCRLCVAQVQALLASADRLATLAQEASEVHARGLDEFLLPAEAHLQGEDDAAHAPLEDASAPGITTGLSAGRAARLLRQVASHMAADAADKQAVARAVVAQAAAQTGRARSGGLAADEVDEAPGPPPVLPERELSERSQVWLSVWMLSPRLAGAHGEEHDEMLLAGLQEALAAADS